jgi:hypothetical protein
MAEVLLSPGVLARENDTTFTTSRPITVGAAIIGPTAKGPVEVPTIVTSYSEFQNIFGTTVVSASNVYTYFTSIAAYNYFESGGESLLVARVVSGAYAPATSTVSGKTGSVTAFELETLSQGTVMNSSGSIDAAGALISGSAENIRWQVVNSNTSSGTFDLLIRRGNDTTLSPVILETWTNLSMDPLTSNYIARVIGDQRYNYASSGTSYYLELTGSYSNKSKYVRVKSVSAATPNYLDNNGAPKVQYTASIPGNNSGSFSNGAGAVKGGANFYERINNSNTQGLEAGNYTNMINLLSNADDYRFNVLVTPGLYNSDYASPLTTIISNTQDRGDNIFILDLVPYNSQIGTVVEQAASRNTSYATSYWGWLQVQDPDTGQQVWVPPSTVIPGVYAFTDSIGAPWFVPAGNTRGGLSRVIRPERKLSKNDRDVLYNGKVNPIAPFPGQGIVVYGNKTLQTSTSALSRISTRRLLIALKTYIVQVANNLLFEQNTTATRNSFLAQVTPYLESVQQRQGIYAFSVDMGDTLNTSDVIDRQELLGKIYIQPTRAIEYIYLDFVLTPTGVSFPS